MVFSRICRLPILIETSLLRCNMSLSNWKGSSGWLSVDDPTGTLNSICLQASSGIGQLCEDYLIQEIGTANAFAKVHYVVQCDLAYDNSENFNGSIAMVARASDYTTSVKKPIVPRQGYIGVIDFNNKVVQIIRLFSEKNYLLSSKKLSYQINPNTKNIMSLRCYGDSSVGGTTIKLEINGESLCEYTDSTGDQILSGAAGFQVQNGTVYINNFAIMELDEYGNVV